jgi:excisionase family DNA binding protein
MPTSPSENNEYVWTTPAAAARVLGVSRASIWRWLKSGHLKQVQVGPRVRRVAVPVALVESARLLAGEAAKGGAR